MMGKALAGFAAAATGGPGGTPTAALVAFLADRILDLGLVAEACNRLGRAVKVALADPNIPLGVALAGERYTDLPVAVRDAVEAQIGRLAVGMTIWACHATAVEGQEPHYGKALAAFLEAAGAASVRLDGASAVGDVSRDGVVTRVVAALAAADDDDFYAGAEAVLGCENDALAAFRDAHPGLAVNDAMRRLAERRDADTPDGAAS